MSQLILHLIGDFITQSHWMAANKTKRWWPAICHSVIYSLPFFLIGGGKAVFIIWSTHLFIDRCRLARYVCFAKNLIGEPGLKWEDCWLTGYPNNVPGWLSGWLMIAADNTLHLTINYLALRFA